MIVVTGGAGFIGSNVVEALNARGMDDILVVDNLSVGIKFKNLATAAIADYQDKEDFLAALQRSGLPDNVRAVVHLGACSSTTEWDGRYIMRNNYHYSKLVLECCLARRIPLVYASSASVYGRGPQYREDPACERPLNPYAYSKWLFDGYVRRRLARAESPVVGLRYFNVYGPREQHKGPMASVAYHAHTQVGRDGRVCLFEGSDGYQAGEQRRDFIHVHDAAAVTLWFLDHPEVSGIFNCGTGRSQTFNEVAQAVMTWHGGGRIEYIAFPPHLAGRYQSYTQADAAALRAAGHHAPFMTVQQGVRQYLDWLRAQDDA